MTLASRWHPRAGDAIPRSGYERGVTAGSGIERPDCGDAAHRAARRRVRRRWGPSPRAGLRGRPAARTPPPWSTPSGRPPPLLTWSSPPADAAAWSGVERVEEGVEGGVDLVGGFLVHPVASAPDDRLAAEVGAGGARVLVGVDAREHPAHRVARAGDEAGRLVDGGAGEVADRGGVEGEGAVAIEG